MATITLKAGDFGAGMAVTVGADALYLPDPRAPGRTESVPLGSLGEVEAVADDYSKRERSAMRLGLAGAALLGPIGLAAGALALRKPKDVTFMARLADGRHFVATADARTYAALRSARLTGSLPAGDGEEPPDEAIDAMITRYVEAKASAPETPGPAAASDPSADAPRPAAPAFGRRHG